MSNIQTSALEGIQVDTVRTFLMQLIKWFCIYLFIHSFYCYKLYPVCIFFPSLRFVPTSPTLHIKAFAVQSHTVWACFLSLLCFLRFLLITSAWRSSSLPRVKAPLFILKTMVYIVFYLPFSCTERFLCCFNTIQVYLSGVWIKCYSD